MKWLQQYRATGWIAALAALLVWSSSAGAIQIDIGGFADNGSLTIMFEGTEMGGDPDKLEFLFPDNLTSFSAVYDDNGLLGPISWGQTDVGSLVYNVSTGILESLNALNFDFLELTVGESVLTSSNYVEITDIFTNQVLASSQQFPVPGTVPAPGALLLLSLGLVLIGIRRRN